ncbi:hypothetical protein Cgig2_010868 [Carnegiea gigantea]|uniref:Uncharacterized protein n=1 Tax=Carnegiea gigantea TaxID=171969 RepID=A0A9Q1JMR7_9CARY|nr:hypothetical protein Cgig2_010868 [Carnegiea gigantea]
MPVHEAPNAIPKTKKPALKCKGEQAIEQKDAQLSAGAALPEDKTSSLGQDVNLKQIPGKFSKFTVIIFDDYVTLDVPIGGREIMKITRSSTDEEYDEVHAAWVKEWKIQHNAPELTRMPVSILAKKDGGESFKRNFIIYLANCFFSRPKNCYYSKSILKYVKDVNQMHP